MLTRYPITVPTGFPFVKSEVHHLNAYGAEPGKSYTRLAFGVNYSPSVYSNPIHTGLVPSVTSNRPYVIP